MTMGIWYEAMMRWVGPAATVHAVGQSVRHRVDESGRRVAERIMNNLATLALPHPDSTPPRITLSFGVASARPPGGEAWRDLIRRADGALYLAKREGRNRIHCDTSTPGADETAVNGGPAR